MYKPDYKQHNFGYWKSRGYLPHFEDPRAIQHVTFHLSDSLPKRVLDRLQQDLATISASQQAVERRRKLEMWLDAGHGSCVLADPMAGELMQNTLHHFDSQRYRLYAWVVMPNHVHVLFEALGGYQVSHIVKSWKSFSARAIRMRLGKSADQE